MSEKILVTQTLKQWDFNRGGEASSRLKQKLAKLGIASSVIRRASIVTYELEMNVIIHSYGGEINVVINQQELKINVKDKGPGIENIEKALEPGYSTANKKIRELGFGAGMGLYNVQKQTDQLKIETDLDKGTKIKAVILLGSETGNEQKTFSFSGG